MSDLGELNNLSDMLKAPAQSTGKPLNIDLKLIEPDPEQPRKYFDPVKLNELVASIKLRGVKTPISVRPNPDKPGHFILNHGERRWRGSNIAETGTIPAYVDVDYSDDDQMIENIQREDLTAREIADWIGKKLSEGRKKGDIAKALGKSNAFVSQYSTLLDLPEAIADIFNSGRCNDVTLINELVTAYKKKPEEVEQWLNDDEQEISRGSVKLFREFLDDKKSDDGDTSGDLGSTDDFNDDGDNDSYEVMGSNPNSSEPKEKDPNKMSKTIVQIEHMGNSGRLVLNRRPSEYGMAWVLYDDGNELEAPMDQLTLIGLMEG